MSAENLLYFKFNLDIIRSGLWAQLSATARTLYPVLLSFSDGNFKPVYPGTKVLLKLTGFKHKTSLQNARRELVEKGLITLSQGNGRKKHLLSILLYWFLAPPGGRFKSPPGGGESLPRRARKISLSGRLWLSLWGR